MARLQARFLSIGSNIEPDRNIPAALKLLQERFRLLRVSPTYETEPVGPAGLDPFWNLAAEIETDLPDVDLVRELRRLEEMLGRRRDMQDKFAPRTIDFDLLPQKDFQRLPFIIIPLADIAPEVRDDETGKTYEDLAKEIKDSYRYRQVLKGGQ